MPMRHRGVDCVRSVDKKSFVRVSPPCVRYLDKEKTMFSVFRTQLTLDFSLASCICSTWFLHGRKINSQFNSVSKNCGLQLAIKLYSFLPYIVFKINKISEGLRKFKTLITSITFHATFSFYHCSNIKRTQVHNSLPSYNAELRWNLQ
jgi:hypothetical protein